MPDVPYGARRGNAENPGFHYRRQPTDKSNKKELINIKIKQIEEKLPTDHCSRFVRDAAGSGL